MLRLIDEFRTEWCISYDIENGYKCGLRSIWPLLWKWHNERKSLSSVSSFHISSAIMFYLNKKKIESNPVINNTM